jgi:hypothetical protein
MATLTYGETTLELPQFKLRELRAAAPYVTRAMRAVREIQGVALEATSEDVVGKMFDGIGDVLAVLAIGVLKLREKYPYTPDKIAAVSDEIEGEIGMSQITQLNATFSQILGEAGMVRANGDPTRMPSEDESSTSETASSE